MASLLSRPGAALAWTPHAGGPAPCIRFGALRGPGGELLDFHALSHNEAAGDVVRDWGLGPRVSRWPLEGVVGPSLEDCARLCATGVPLSVPLRVRRPGVEACFQAVAVPEADGFALNVSNFVTTASNVSYGQQVSTLLGGAHFVVDTSRNGNGPGSDWCNPPGRAVGQRPTSQTGQVGVDAFLWVKRPGESDGECNGGPAAGTFWASYAIGLMRGAA